MLSQKTLAILAVYFGLSTASPLLARQECGGDWECTPATDAVPRCALPMLAYAAEEVGCSATDYECRCSKRNQMTSIVLNLFISPPEGMAICDQSMIGELSKSTDAVCACVNNAGNPPPACPEPSSSAPAPSSSAPVPSSSAPAPSSSAPVPSSSAPVPSSSAPVPSSTPAPSGGYPSSSSEAAPSGGYPTASPPAPSYSAEPSKPAAPSSSKCVPKPAPSAPAPGPGPAPGPWECQSQLDAIASCAIPVIARYAPEVGCGAVDYECRCDNAAELTQLALNDVIDACTIDVALTVRTATAALCECVATNGGPPAESGGDAPVDTAPVDGGDSCEDDGNNGGDDGNNGGDDGNSGGDDEYPTDDEPPKEDEDDSLPPKDDDDAAPAPYPTDDAEPPVVTAGAAKNIIGSGAAALLALVAAL